MIAPFLIIIKIRFQEVRKKEYLQYGKHNEEFNADDQP
jgi:hypothetical protein